MPINLVHSTSKPVELNNEEDVCTLLRQELADAETGMVKGVIIISFDDSGEPSYSHSTMSKIEAIGAIEMVKHDIINDG